VFNLQELQLVKRRKEEQPGIISSPGTGLGFVGLSDKSSFTFIRVARRLEMSSLRYGESILQAPTSTSVRPRDKAQFIEFRISNGKALCAQEESKIAPAAVASPSFSLAKPNKPEEGRHL
jgi:hypothetical protein